MKTVNDFQVSNASQYQNELNYMKSELDEINTNSYNRSKGISISNSIPPIMNNKFLTPNLDRHVNYESYKSENGFRRRYLV
jgi:hypothetical protein